MKITIKDREIDLEKSMPLVWADTKKAKQISGLSAKQLADGDIEGIEALLLVLIQKQMPEASISDLDSQKVSVIEGCFAFINNRQLREDRNIDRPI